MDEYYGSYILQNENMAQSTPFPCFPSSSYGAIPFFYTRNLLPNGTTIISAQMNPHSNATWTNNANISVAPPQSIPSPRQVSFEEYWRQVSSEENSNVEHNRRHSSSTSSAMSSDGSTSGTIMPIGHTLNLLPPASTGNFPQTRPLITPVPHNATRYHAAPAAPRLQLGPAVDHGVQAFLPPPSMKVSPGVNSTHSNESWSNDNSPMDARTMANTTSGALHASGSAPLWRGVPRSAGSSGQLASSVPRWNQSSSSWVPQAAMASRASIPQPHAQTQTQVQIQAQAQAQAQAHMRELLNGLPTAFKAPLPISDGAMPQPSRRHTSDAVPMSMPRMTTSSSLVDRTPRPALSVRRRGSTASAIVNPQVVLKRKPLPKIYGCDGCGKKFDRPSTLKVHEAIHTGAKDHLCEYCIRAFTVQSNMKRHMRVCKHKPLSPPMSLCYILCTTPSLPPHTSFLFPSSSKAMNPVDRSNNLNLSASAASIHPSLALTHPRPNPTMQGPSGNLTMVPFEYTYPLPDPELPVHPGPIPAPTVRGYRAPMIIAAMFSVQQNVPASLAKFTLVHLECDIPLQPVTPHPSQVSLYTGGSGLPTQPVPKTERPSSAYEPPYARPSAPSSSATAVSSRSSVYMHPSLASSSSLESSSSTCVGTSQHTHVSVTTSIMTEFQEDEQDELVSAAAIKNIKAKGLKELPDINFEERNSYYPRSRYCYHPAEFDAIAVLPGPGTVALASSDDE